MGQILMIAIAIVVLLVGTFLFARLFRAHTSLDRRAAAVAGFVLSLGIVVVIEAAYLAVGQW